MNFDLSTAQKGKRSGKAHVKNAALVALAAVLAAGVIGVIFASNSGRLSSLPTCENRLVILDTSSSARSPKVATLAQHIIDAAATSAVVCSSNLQVYAVAGGGDVTPIISSSDLESFAVVGANEIVRSSRFSQHQRALLTMDVARRLREAYVESNPRTTSVMALYNIADQISTAFSHVIIVTTGVNNDASLDLNVPLARGEGIRLARSLHIAPLNAASLTVIGIAQVDDTVAPPSSLWPEEIYQFNRDLAIRSGVNSLHVLDISSPAQILNY